MSTPETSWTARWEPTPRWERRYREVLDAAATVFAEKGYAGASTRDIAERLNIRQASLYYYFPSKEAALAAICELGVKDFIGNLQTILAEPTPTADKFRAAIANHLAPLRSNPEADYIRVFLRHRHELPDGLRQSVAALARTYQGLVERLFAGRNRQTRAESRTQSATRHPCVSGPLQFGHRQPGIAALNQHRRHHDRICRDFEWWCCCAQGRQYWCVSTVARYSKEDSAKKAQVELPSLCRHEEKS